MSSPSSVLDSTAVPDSVPALENQVSRYQGSRRRRGRPAKLIEFANTADLPSRFRAIHSWRMVEVTGPRARGRYGTLRRQAGERIAPWRRRALRQAIGLPEGAVAYCLRHEHLARRGEGYCAYATHPPPSSVRHPGSCVEVRLPPPPSCRTSGDGVPEILLRKFS